MTRTTSSVAVLALLALLPTAAVGQDATDALTAGETELVGTSVSFLGGRMEGAPTLAADTRLSSGTAVGASVTRWALPWFGFRARVLRADQEVLGTNHPDLQERIGDGGDIWLLGGDVLFRARLPAGRATLLPYAAAGVGFKRYMVEDPWNDTAFDAGVGLEVRLGRLGVFGEGSRVVTDFDAAGRTDFAGEWLYTGGVSVHVG